VFLNNLDIAISQPDVMIDRREPFSPSEKVERPTPTGRGSV
jgi:hypothetical protein